MADRRPAKSWFAKRPEPAPPPDRQPPVTGGSPTITAELRDGPLKGSSIEAEPVEGRPPKTIDVDADDGACRYCLAQWEQSGGSAVYTFLYRV